MVYCVANHKTQLSTQINKVITEVCRLFHSIAYISNFVHMIPSLLVSSY